MIRGCVCFGLVVTLGGVPAFCPAQAPGIGRPSTLPDSYLIKTQCAAIEEHYGQQRSDDPVRAVLEKARVACSAYSEQRMTRDQWLTLMFALQDEMGPAVARKFMPQFDASKPLPADLDSYSLFLFPDPRWRSEQAYRGNLEAIWRAFFDFGQTIGDTRLAIWFLDSEGNVDVLRSQLYCTQFGLNYNDGPYIVTAKKRPDLLEANDEIVYIKLGGISPDRIPPILNILAQDLREGRDIRTGRLVFEEVKQWLLTASTRYPDVLKGVLAAVGLVK